MKGHKIDKHIKINYKKTQNGYKETAIKEHNNPKVMQNNYQEIDTTKKWPQKRRYKDCNLLCLCHVRKDSYFEVDCEWLGGAEHAVVCVYSDVITEWAQQRSPKLFSVRWPQEFLSDEDFENLLGTTRQDFYRLPKWRQSDLKKKAGIFWETSAAGSRRMLSNLSCVNVKNLTIKKQR